MECSICLEEKNNFIRNWQCNHSFCYDCSDNLLNRTNNLKCPICRDNNLITNNLQKNMLDIQKIKKNLNKLNNESHYISQWRRKKCIEENHRLLIRNIYGVVIICENCNLIDTFSYTLS